MPTTEAYIDIETYRPYLFRQRDYVVGFTSAAEKDAEFIQFVGRDITRRCHPGSPGKAWKSFIPITAAALTCLLFILSAASTWLNASTTRDLMFDCWVKKLYGGLKGVEKQLGVARNLPDMNGLKP